MTGALTLENFQALREKRPLCEPLSLSAAPGTILALVGPNGVGKSTLLSAIAHTGVPHRGSARYDGTALASLSASRRAHVLALLAQSSRGTDELRVRELVEIGARAGGPARDIRTRAAEAIELVDIAAIADRRLGTLSGGQRQLAQLGRVAAQQTPIVVLDEPAAALDLAHQVLVERIALSFAARGRIVIAAVHDLSFALTIATDALLLSPDGTATHGAPRDVLSTAHISAAYGVPTSTISTSAGRTLLAIDELAHPAVLPRKESS